MPSYVSPSDAVRGHCFLTDGKHGKKITKDAWFVVRNRYSEAVVAAVPKAVKATKTNVVLERADETDAAEKEAEIKEEEVEEEIKEDGVETASDSGSTDNGKYLFKKHKPAPVKEGVGAKTQEPKVSWTYTWIPLVMVVLLVMALAGLIASKNRSQSA
jgi:hypothetical protein